MIVENRRATENEVWRESPFRLAVMARPRLIRAAAVLIPSLVVAAAIALWAGHRFLSLTELIHDPLTQSIFFRLRLPRVLLAAIIGASLAVVGTALQALFR